jgi:hypothetical protein
MSSEDFTDKEVRHIADVKQKLERLIKDVGLYERRHPSWDKSEGVSTDDGYNREFMVVAGGCISSLLRNERYNDIDTFLLKNESFHPKNPTQHNMLENMIRHKPGTWSVKYHLDEDDDYSNEHIFATARNHDSNVQYIKTDFTDRKALIDHFDFIHCMASYHEGRLYISHQTYNAIMNKHLIVNGNKKVKKWRLDKFRGRDWKTKEDLLIDEPVKSKSQSLEEMLRKVRVGGPTKVDDHTKVWPASTLQNPAVKAMNMNFQDFQEGANMPAHQVAAGIRTALQNIANRNNSYLDDLTRNAMGDTEKPFELDDIISKYGPNAMNEMDDILRNDTKITLEYLKHSK